MKYGRGRQLKVYEAKVLKIETDTDGKMKYFVHYSGWNSRYDEWIRKNRIVEVTFNNFITNKTTTNKTL